MANPIASLHGFHVCANACALRALAHRVGLCLERGACVGLDGPLGAGKTEFVKGMAEGLGCVTAPTSPTFAVAHEYEGREMTLYHFDFYRMEDISELETCGFWECLTEGVTAAEWASKFEDVLPPGHLQIQIAFRGEGGRSVEIR
jgi:tRNA threonylcarbamoyladenosine biosynthesis protein TsaE